MLTRDLIDFVEASVPVSRHVDRVCHRIGNTDVIPWIDRCTESDQDEWNDLMQVHDFSMKGRDGMPALISRLGPVMGGGGPVPQGLQEALDHRQSPGRGQ